MKVKSRAALSGLAALLPLTLSAQVSWTGGATPDTDWATPGNWFSNSGPAAPTAADSVTIDGGGHAFITTTDAAADTLTVGDTVAGELTISDGGVLTVSTGSILGSGLGSSGVVTVTGANASWNTGAGDLVVGSSGEGSLTISDGGVVNSANVDLASVNKSGPGTTQGTVLVTGAGSAWNVAGTFLVGGYSDETHYNNATLTVADGGSLTIGTEIGTENETLGTLTIFNRGVVRIGEAGPVAGLGGTLIAGEIAFDDSGYIDDATTPSADAPKLEFNHTDNISLAARLSGYGVITKAGSGTLTFTGNGVADAESANAFGGDIDISDGTVVLDVNGYWNGDGRFTVTGSDTVLRIATGTTLIGDLEVTASTLTLDSSDALLDSELMLVGGSALTLGASGALSNTLVLMFPDYDAPGTPQINLNGHDAAFTQLYAPVGRIINDSPDGIATVTIGNACGCGGGLSAFLGTFSEPSGGQIGLNIVGGNGLVLSGTQTYTGPTVVDGSVGQSALFVVHAVEPGVLVSSPITLLNGSLLGGDGTVNAVTIVGGGMLSPGDYGSHSTGFVGTLTTTGDIFIANDADAAEHSFLNIDIYDAANPTPGAGVDFLNILGKLTFSDDLNDTFTVNVGSIGDTDDLALNFDPSLNYSWQIASIGGGIVNLDLSRIFVDAALFKNAIGRWTITHGMIDDKEVLNLNYAPIPEPAAFVLLGSLGVLPALLRRRRR